MSKIIKDPVHGYISVEDFLIELIDTLEIQRLRRIRQLGFSYLVYPGANHTRFEHSLGTYHLATMLINNLNLNETDKKSIQAAALLHDIGHGPFSHTSEEVIERAGGPSHEEFAKNKIKNSDLSKSLEKNNVPLNRVLDLIDGEGEFGEAISSELDVDRMDYLVRDAHYTGVAYGSIDYERLINEIDFMDGELIVKEGGLRAAESLLVSRFLMQPTVYFHHASRIAETMAARAIEKAFINDLFTPEEFRNMFDNEVLLKMSNSDDDYVKEIANRLLNRKLFKRAVSRDKEILQNDIIKKIRDDDELRRDKKREIASKCGLDNRIIIDIPPPPRMDEMETNVLQNGKIKEISEVSNLVSILSKSGWEYWRFGIYSPKEKTEEVKKASEEALGI